jgi:hypothetical protein
MKERVKAKAMLRPITSVAFGADTGIFFYFDFLIKI